MHFEGVFKAQSLCLADESPVYRQKKSTCIDLGTEAK